MKVNDNKIMAVLNKYDDAIRSAGAFFIEVDEDEVFITDSCEGIDMMPLDKELCMKLSAMFKELGESL